MHQSGLQDGEVEVSPIITPETMLTPRGTGQPHVQLIAIRLWYNPDTK